MIKDQLRGYVARKRELAQLEDMLREVEARLASPKISHLTGMPSSPSPDSDQMAALVDRHLRLQELYTAKIAELTEQQLEVEGIIDSLEPREREIFRLRYIRGMQWEDICVRTNYSWRQIYRAHSEALKKLERIKHEQ